MGRNLSLYANNDKFSAKYQEKKRGMNMSDYIDETPLTDEEVAAAIAEAKARKAALKSKRSDDAEAKADAADKASGGDSDKSVSIKKNDDDDNLGELLDESSSAAALEEEEDETPAVKSAKSFSNAFAAAKMKREQELLKLNKKKEEEPDENEEDEEYEEDEEDDETAEAEDADEYEDDDEYEYEEDDEDEDEDEYEEDDEEEDEEDSEDDDDEEDDDDDADGIFETDDENGEYGSMVNVDEEDEDDDDGDEDEDEEEDDDDDGAFSAKTKVVIGIVIAVLILAIIAAVAFFMRNPTPEQHDPEVVSSQIDDSITGVRFKESSISIKVGQTVELELIVEPEDAADKTFKIKSNDDTIAKMTDDGKIMGIASGSTTVTATLKSNPAMTASMVVNVIDEEQSALNTYNKFVNDILDGTTDIDSESDTETESESEDEENNEEGENNSDTESDTEKTAHTPKHVLTGNKIADFDSDGELELALYYQPNTDNEEPLVRLFHMASEEEETDSEEEKELPYDEYGNIIETEESDTETESDSSSDKEPAEKKLTEIYSYSELYMTCYSAIEADSATNPWNTSYVEVKETEQATARVRILSKGYDSPTYTYESEDEEIATVDNQGNIMGVKPGTVFITVSSPLNSDAIAKIKVRVKDDTDLLDDYLADIPIVNSTNDNIFPTETLIGKAIVDIDNDGVSELLLRFSYSDNVEAINIIKVENEKCVCYKTYNNISDLYEYNDGNGSYKNDILVHYTSGRVCLRYEGVVSKEGSKSRTTEMKILTLENSGSLSELANFRTTTEISTKTVTSEVVVDNSTTSDDTESDVDTESETEWYDNDESDVDTDSSGSESEFVDEDNDGYDDNTGEYFGSYAAFTFDEIAEAGGIDLSVKTPAKKLPEAAGAPDDEDEDDAEEDDNNDYDNDADSDEQDNNNDDDDDEPVTSTVTTEISEESTKYFVNGTPVDRSVYDEFLTRYSSTYSVWSAWESVH